LEDLKSSFLVVIKLRKNISVEKGLEKKFKSEQNLLSHDLIFGLIDKNCQTFIGFARISIISDFIRQLFSSFKRLIVLFL
jgi:hypothetical protein